MECIYNLPDIKNCIDHDCVHCLDLDVAKMEEAGASKEEIKSYIENYEQAMDDIMHGLDNSEAIRAMGYDCEECEELREIYLSDYDFDDEEW